MSVISTRPIPLVISSLTLLSTVVAIATDVAAIDCFLLRRRFFLSVLLQFAAALEMSVTMHASLQSVILLVSFYGTSLFLLLLLLSVLSVERYNSIRKPILISGIATISDSLVNNSDMLV